MTLFRQTLTRGAVRRHELAAPPYARTNPPAPSFIPPKNRVTTTATLIFIQYRSMSEQSIHTRSSFHRFARIGALYNFGKVVIIGWFELSESRIFDGLMWTYIKILVR